MIAPRIVVTTPTGNVGSEVAWILVRAGVRPTLLCRSRERLPPSLVRYADVVELDQTDEPAVVESTRGADALFWVAPPGTDEDPVAGYRRLGEVAAAAMIENDIDRVVFQSSVGAETRHGLGEIDGLGGAEEALDAANRTVAHLRCGYFFSNLLGMADQLRQGILPTTFPLDLRQAWVAPRDIAGVASGLLLSSSWRGRRVQAVHGPEDLSFTDVARILTETTGHTVAACQIADDELAAALTAAGLPQPSVEGLVGMARGIRSGFRAEDARTPRTTTPTTLAEWVVAHRADLGLG
jgi:uncharacterized protein YbjT (DUF2867 family)